MSDRYQQLVNTPIGKIVTKQIGLPSPVKLERYERGQPVVSGPVLLGAAPGGRIAGAVANVLAAIDAEVHTRLHELERTAAADAGLDAGVWSPDAAPEDQTFKALVFDASGIENSEQLREAWAFFGPTIRRVRGSGRVIVLGAPPEDCKRPRQATAQRALEGLVRSIGKELRKGATAQLIYVGAKAEPQIESTLRFFLSPKSAYVSGQVVRIGASALPADGIDWELPLSGTVRARDRRLEGHRESDRQGARARRRPRDRARRARPAARARGDDRRARRLDAGARHHRRGRAGADRHLPARDARRRRRGRAQRRRDAGQDARADGRGPVEHGARDQPDRSGADQRRAARARGDSRERADRVRVVDERHRRQRRPDQLRDLQGRRDRHGRVDGAGARQEAADDQRGGARVHRDPDDRGDADCHA